LDVDPEPEPVPTVIVVTEQSSRHVAKKIHRALAPLFFDICVELIDDTLLDPHRCFLVTRSESTSRVPSLGRKLTYCNSLRSHRGRWHLVVSSLSFSHRLFIQSLQECMHRDTLKRLISIVDSDLGRYGSPTSGRWCDGLLTDQQSSG
jgi:hypothetical protein